MRTSNLCKHCGGACCESQEWIYLREEFAWYDRWDDEEYFDEKKRDEVFENLKKELLENLKRFRIDPPQEKIEECLSIVRKRFQKENSYERIKSPCCIFLTWEGCLIPESRPSRCKHYLCDEAEKFNEFEKGPHWDILELVKECISYKRRFDHYFWSW
ncbi:MAG: hypothetical protein ACXQS8_06355 [Candidatus Helarchaeales archaeon]